MPIDNDYFKNRQQNSGGGNNSGGNGGGYTPPFEPPEMFKNFGKKAGLIYGAIIVILILVLAKPFAIVNSGEVGIKITTGKYGEEPLRPGFHLFIPVIQKVIFVDTKVRLMHYTAVEDVGAFDAGIRVNNAINILDSRGLPVSIDLTVQYRLLPDGAPATIANWGLSWEEKIINPVVRDIVRSVVGSFTAEELPVKRNEIANLIELGIREKIDALRDQPVELQSVQLREIILPPKIKEQIERVQIANQEAERTRYEVERARQEAQKVAALAEGEAQAKRIAAQGQADAILIEAKAQSESNNLISRSLTKDLLHLEQVKVQGKFNEALRENKDAKIFLTPGGSTPNIWVDTKDNQRTSSISGN
ncbi:prohibitin family protein [Arcobacter sp. FWKO B]|uniref:prohibitin family protein n=1 Tax=Arcobacter sp. FWKO B TaxID=2593672 RepID=UPI0018A4D993|nr:prohibitin family protein [Arcobacter sp. FWKO B]QOG12578.1 prohibitin family protein [Arcobacter sp. FWKO B]